MSYKNNYLLIHNDDVKKIFMDEIGIVIMTNTQVNVTGVALREMSKRKIKVIMCDEKYNPYGELVSYYGSHNTSKKLRLQTLWDDEIKETMFTHIIDAKIHNQASLLQELGFEEQSVALNEYRQQLQFFDETNCEGHAAKVYFNALFDITNVSLTNKTFLNTLYKKLRRILLPTMTKSCSWTKYMLQ